MRYPARRSVQRIAGRTDLPAEAKVIRVNVGTVDVQAKGSGTYFRGVATIGGGDFAVGDTCLMVWSRGRPLVLGMTAGVSSAPELGGDYAPTPHSLAGEHHTGMLPWARISGAPGFLTAVGEGPGIDIVDQRVVGLGGDAFLVYSSNGGAVAEHTSLDSASAAAMGGDVVWLPAGTVAGDHTLAANVHYIGLAQHPCVLTGRITLAPGASLSQVCISRTASSGLLVGIVSSASGAAYLHAVRVVCENTGGDCYGISATGGGTVHVQDCYIAAQASGVGYGVYRSSGSVYNRDSWIWGSTAPYNE